MPFRARNVIREGIIAGVIGATGIAVWFLIVDTIAQRPLFTPGILGNALLSLSVFQRGPTTVPESFAASVVAYTVFHYVAFCIAGIVVSVVVGMAETTPSILGGFFILFIAFELGIHFLVASLQEATVLGALAWYQIMIGNLLAALLMGAYLWRRHPELSVEVRHALDGLGE
ncbi:MAG: hypothetical protein ACT4P7_00725 [Gemmatimonadaceae bacterium]